MNVWGQGFRVRVRVVRVSVKEPVCHCRRHKRWGFDSWNRTILWSRRCHLLQHSWLENSIDRGAWWVTVYGVTKSRRRLNTHTHTHTHTHKSIWRELTYFPIHDHDMPLHLFTSSGFFFCFVCLFFTYIFVFVMSLVAHLMKNLPAVQKTSVQSLGWEDPREKGMATHFSILAWKIS